jgi:hypothetical protein
MSAIPENLTECCNCGLPFAEPVDVETALEYFAEVDEAAFVCASCESHV